MHTSRILLGLTIVALSLGVLVRLAILDVGSWWLDELWTLDAISRTYKEMIGARLLADQSPPLGTSAAWAWLQLVGTYDAAAMRTLPFALSIAGIGAPMFGALKMPRLRSTLLVMAALLALSVFAIHYAVELRPYAMMIAFESWATVIWAGLLTRELPRTVPYLFGFAVFGAIGGLTHYYGNLSYLAESAILSVTFFGSRDVRLVLKHVGLGALSLVPVTVWYLYSRPWAANEAVAGPPSLATILTVMDYALAPLTTVLRGTPQGYPEATFATMGVLAILGAGAILIAARTIAAHGEQANHTFQGISALVLATIATIALAAAIAFIASIVLPPSMNVRNLAALLPVILLGVASIATAVPASVRAVAGCVVIAVFLGASGVLATRYGLEALAPPWQQSAGYQSAAETLIEKSSASSSQPQLVGLETAWHWHGHWDAVIRSELGSPPAISSDPAPMAVAWISDSADVGRLQVDPDGTILFTDTTDERWTTALAWANQHYGSCKTTTYGGSTVRGADTFGQIMMVSCE